MSEHNITVEGGASVRLKTAGKYCDRDIVVTASGGAGGSGDNGGWAKCNTVNPDGTIPISDISDLKLDCQFAVRIEEKAWMDSALKEINMPKVEVINNYAFANCLSLSYVNAPKATNIGEHAFLHCDKLMNINLPSATTIGYCAFDYCTKLIKVDLGAATTIGEFAFRDCISLTTLILRTTETVCVIDLTAFDESSFLFNSSTGTNNGYIYVPSVMYEYYRIGYEEPLASALGAGAFDRIVRKIEDYPEICG